jgi:Zn-dependent metalloprotease
MSQYSCSASRGDPHHNSTILSHAYHRFVQEVGHARAGNVLQYIPFFLAPIPRFADVRQGFIVRAGGLYPNDPGVRAAAERAFAEIRSPGC